MYKREGPRLRFGRWVSCGNARVEQRPCPNCGARPADAKVHLFLDRLPTGGFTGYALAWPFGKKPPPPTAAEMQTIEQGGIDQEGDPGKDAEEEEED
jgi:hypothetical protein